MSLPKQQIKKFTDEGEVLEDLPEEQGPLPKVEQDTRSHPLYGLAMLAVICVTIMVSIALITR